MSRVKQEKFVNNYIKTGNKTKSYMEAYNNNNYNSSASSATQLLKNPKVRQLYESKLAELQDISVLTAIERQKLLSNIAITSKNNADKIKSVDVLNKMDNTYTDSKIDNKITLTIQNSDLKDYSE